MSKRRVRVNLKSQCVPYLDLDPSPSKRRNFRTRTLPVTRVVDISGAEVHSKKDIESDNKGVTFFSFDGDNEQEDLPHPNPVPCKLSKYGMINIHFNYRMECFFHTSSRVQGDFFWWIIWIVQQLLQKKLCALIKKVYLYPLVAASIVKTII